MNLSGISYYHKSKGENLAELKKEEPLQYFIEAIVLEFREDGYQKRDW